MSANVFYDNIEKYLFQYVDLLEHSNSLGLTDKAIHAENLFAILLNQIFDWNLTNANEINRNQSSFDLIYREGNVAIQVTTNKNHKTKFNDTIKKFENNGIDAAIDQFIILFIAKKINISLLLSQTINGVVYECYDLSKLLDKILYTCTDPDQLEKINRLLEKTINPVQLGIPNLTWHFLPALIPKQSIVKLNQGIYILRTELIKDLFDFIQNDNGLLIGGPGFGKSFTIEELQRFCVSQEIPCFIIRINDLTEGTGKEIGEELKMDENWLEVLSKMNHSSRKQVLIFDAFDTAKDEKLKSNILKFVKKSLLELTPSWHILVSVRTYDATKSRKLLELFPNQSIRQSVSCRHFMIPELSEQELETAFDSSPALKQILRSCNPELKKLLSTPYFLKLFEQILNDGEDETMVFNSVETEEELLQIFWDRKVEDVAEKELLLYKLTTQLAHNESMVCDKHNIITDTNLKAYEDLTSLGIIEAASVTRQKISYTHNILLDFAICKYLLKQEIDDQIHYIKSNEKMPFIFRQSFIYFYTKLYKGDTNLFWRHYERIAFENEPLFRLLHQTTINFVLISCYQKPDDLRPIFNEADSEKKAQHLRKVLEGIRFITKGNIRERDVDLILKISSNLHWLPLWETGYLLEKGIAQFSSSSNTVILKKLSDASCNCLEFVLAGRKNAQNKILLDRNGGIRGIDNVCDTLPYNLKKVKLLLREVLLILKEEDFPIDYFYRLANNITKLYRHDTKLATLIYKILYDHTEVSDKETNLGNGVVMALRSNRKQDYGMVYYCLEKAFDDLLKIDFYPAMQLGIAIISVTNSHSSRRSAFRETVPLKVGDIDTQIFSDYSFYDNDRDNGPSSHIIKIFEILEFKLNEDIEAGMRHIYSLLPEIKAAMVWRRMLKLVAKYPSQLRTLAFDLLLNKEFYMFDETVYESGELIAQVWQYLDHAGRKTIEDNITSLQVPNEPDGSEFVLRRVNRLLNCIPEGEVLTRAAMDVLSSNSVIKNTPVVQSRLLMADVSYSSREELIKRAGFNLEDDLDMLHYRRIEELEAFNEKFEKKDNKLLKRDCKSILSFVELMFLEATGWTKRKKETAEHQIGRFARVYSSLGQKLNQVERKLVKTIALQYLFDPAYFGSEYESGDLKNSWGSFNASARTASVGTVINLMSVFKEKDLEEIVLALMGDDMQIVRFKSLRALSYFWSNDNSSYWNKVRERSLKELDSMCLHELIRAVCYDNIMKKDRANVEEVTQTVMHKMREADDEIAREIWQVLIVTMLKLLLFHNSTNARQLVTNSLDIKEFSRSIIFEIMNVIDPHSLENNYDHNPAKYQELIGILMEILAYRFNWIQVKGLHSANIMDDFGIIDHVIQHLYFTIEKGRKGNKDNTVEHANRKAFYVKIKPVIDFIVEQSTLIESGFMIAHTGYYFMQMLNALLDLDPEHILHLSNTIVMCAAKNGFTYDSSTLKEVVELTEHIIADHKQILYKNQNFNNLIVVLDQFSNSGWQEAMEMTWRLKEAF